MLKIQSNQQTMNSREIAHLTGKLHKDVLESIRRILDDVGIDWADFSAEYKDTTGRYLPCFNLPRRECDLVIAGYSAKYRLAIIDRWQELETKQAALPSYPEALRQLASSLELNAQQQDLIEQQKPAVAFVERYVEARSSKCLSDVAKILQRKPQEFITELAADKVIFKRGGNLVAFQDYIDRGLFTLYTGESNGHAFVQTKVEPDGIVWLAKRYGKDM